MNPARLFLALAVTLAISRVTTAAEPAPLVEARHGLVVSVNPEASDAGLQVLKDGGNAVDAAITTAFALAVTFPEAGNIGGGGFMMIAPPSGEPVCVEYRETAPRAATADTFVNEKSKVGHKTVGVPGTVRGLALAHEKFGKLPWSRLVEPAVKLAHEGFAIDAALASALNGQLERHAAFPEFRRVFSKPDSGKWQAGDRLVQPELATTLARIAADGADAFYTGPIARQIVTEMQAGGGLITEQDLADYRANVRKPVTGTYRGFTLFGSPPPSSGGTVIVETLNILENFDLRKHERFAPETIQLIVEAMKRAYCDRARYLGDPAFTEIPSHLTTKEYAKKLAATIDPSRATPSEKLAPEIKLADEGESTTHFSVIDSNGMAVSNTYTLQESYGSRVVVRGAGFLLNNEMTDFNWRPGHTDRSGAIGTPANVIKPGKRMVSSQSPTFVFRDGKLLLVTGSPGGRTIPNTVLSILISVMDYGMNVREAVDAPRLHHQWLPDQISFEGHGRPEFAELVSRLEAMGHDVTGRKQGDAHSILVRDGVYYGAADGRRTVGKAAGY
jgi:gamma-glutamyltranspeptidase/glutathione hydrolase